SRCAPGLSSGSPASTAGATRYSSSRRRPLRRRTDPFGLRADQRDHLVNARRLVVADSRRPAIQPREQRAVRLRPTSPPSCARKRWQPRTLRCPCHRASPKRRILVPAPPLEPFLERVARLLAPDPGQRLSSAALALKSSPDPAPL